MGNQNAAMCLNCFIKYNNIKSEETDSILIENPLIMSSTIGNISEMKPITSIDDEKTLNIVDKPLSTRTEELLIRSNDICQQFISMIQSSETDTSFVEALVKEGITIYCKDLDQGFMLKAVWKTPYTSDEFMNFMGNVENRKKWDRNLDKIKIIDTLDDNTRLMHLLYKRILTISPRELLILNRQHRQGDVWMDISTSFQSSEYPMNPSYIRAHLYIGGYIIEPCQDENGNQTKITNIVQADFGGSLPINMLKKMTALTLPQFATSITKGIEKMKS